MLIIIGNIEMSIWFYQNDERFLGLSQNLKKVLFKPVALEIPLIEQKEQFLFVLCALVTRLISLQKAAEIMVIEPDMFIKILELMGIEFSYLCEDDVLIENEWLSS